MNWARDHQMLSDLRSRYDLTRCVETGAGGGQSAEWLTRLFDPVWTCEASAGYYEAAWLRLSQQTKTKLYFGDSTQFLGLIRPRMRGNILFYLDAHYDGPDTAGLHKPCPVLDELCAIDIISWTEVIVIDDADLFTKPLPKTRSGERWPNFEAIERTVAPWGCSVTVIEENNAIVIARTPEDGQE